MLGDAPGGNTLAAVLLGASSTKGALQISSLRGPRAATTGAPRAFPTTDGGYSRCAASAATVSSSRPARPGGVATAGHGGFAAAGAAVAWRGSGLSLPSALRRGVGASQPSRCGSLPTSSALQPPLELPMAATQRQRKTLLLVGCCPEVNGRGLQVTRPMSGSSPSKWTRWRQWQAARGDYSWQRVSTR